MSKQQVIYYPLTGGLDVTTPAISANPGTARVSLNYEADTTGYRRISGFERFDGRLSPTQAYEDAPNEAQGAIDRDAARAAIQKVPGDGPVRGVWYYNGETYAFRDVAQTEYVTEPSFGTAAGWTLNGGATISGGNLNLGTNSAAKAFQQSTGAAAPIIPGERFVVVVQVTTLGDTAPHVQIGPNSGTSEVLDGVLVVGTNTIEVTATNSYPNLKLTLANTTGGSVGPVIASVSVKRKSAGGMYKATASGWATVSLSFSPGGHYEFINYNFIGAASGVKMYGINGVDKGFQFDASGLVFITTGMPVDVPIKLAAHKRHLFFAFAGGSVQHSSLGDPLTWNPITGAAEIAVGDEVTDLIGSAPANLAIMAKNSISMLYGNDVSDWQLEPVTNEAGAIANTAEKFGPVVYMDNRGIRSMATTPSFGNFNIGTMTQRVAPLIRTKLAAGDLPTAACRVRAKDTYRVFWSDGYGLSVFMGKKNPEVCPIDLGVGVTCIHSVETEDTSEKIWFGSDDGYVYQMDRGRSFDGQPVGYYLRLPFHHINAPNMLKRWHRVSVEYDSSGPFTLRIAGEIDNADPDEPSLAQQNLTGYGGGAFWGSGLWDQFYWSAPIDGDLTAYIDGVGKNMSLLFGGEQADEEPHILQGLTLFYSMRGMLR